MTFARVSQAVAEVLRQNGAPNAQVSQVLVEVLRKPLSNPNARVDQVVLEVLRKRLPDIHLSQVVAEVMRAERTLSVNAAINFAATANLIPGSAISAAGDFTLISTAGLALGSELSAITVPLASETSAALQVEPRLSTILNANVIVSAQLEEGIELDAAYSITMGLRAGLRVHPQPVSGFFLLF